MDEALIEVVLTVSLIVISLYAASMYALTIRMYSEYIDNSIRIRVKAAVLREVYHGIDVLINDKKTEYKSTIYFDTRIGVRGDGTEIIITYKGVEDRIDLSNLVDNQDIESITVSGGGVSNCFNITLTIDDNGNIGIEIEA